MSEIIYSLSKPLFVVMTMPQCVECTRVTSFEALHFIMKSVIGAVSVNTLAIYFIIASNVTESAMTGACVEVKNSLRQRKNVIYT